MPNLPVPTVFDARQLLHRPQRELQNGEFVAHAEKAERAQIVLRAIGGSLPAKDHGLDPLLAVHSAPYLDFLRTAHEQWRAAGRTGEAVGYTWPVVHRRDLPLDRIDAKLGRYSYDAGTSITADTWQSAYWGAQSALTALRLAIDEGRGCAFALCRPPGHHAGPDYLGGYCYINNAAVGAAAAAESGRRVAILDVDYHHGNGTQDIFYGRGDVLFVSIHADPASDYPFYWGYADETGTGAGEGKTLNLPLPRGTRIDAYADALDRALEAVSAHGTELLVISFGADTFEDDPISHFGLTTQDFERIGERISAIGLQSCIVMEGGYAVEALGENVAAFLSGFDR